MAREMWARAGEKEEENDEERRITDFRDGRDGRTPQSVPSVKSVVKPAAERLVKEVLSRPVGLAFFRGWSTVGLQKGKGGSPRRIAGGLSRNLDNDAMLIYANDWRYEFPALAW